MSIRRRIFLGGLGSAVLSLIGAHSPLRRIFNKPSSGFDRQRLSQIAAASLPQELPQAQVATVVDDFFVWIDNYKPGKPLRESGFYSFVRGLVSGDSPRKRWENEIVDIGNRCSAKHGKTFDLISLDQQRQILRDALMASDLQMRSAGMTTRLPTLSAEEISQHHVVRALMWLYFSSPAATNDCFGRVITPRTCRPMSPDLIDPPKPVDGHG